MKKIAAITAIFVAILLFVFPNVLYAVNEPATEIVKKVQIQIYDKNGQPVGTPLTIYNKETNEQSTLYKDFSESYIDVIEAGDSEPGSRRVPIYITSFPVKYETIVEFDSEALEGIAGGWTSVKNVFLWKRIGSGSLNCGWGEQYIGTRPVKFSPLPVAGEKGISRERIEGTNPNDDISPLPYIVHFQKNNYCKKNIFFNGNELSLEIVLQKQDSEIRYSSSFSFNHIKTLLPTLSCLIRFQDTNGTEITSASNETSLKVNLSNLDGSDGGSRFLLDGNHIGPLINENTFEFNYLLGTLPVGNHTFKVVTRENQYELCSIDIPISLANTIPTPFSKVTSSPIRPPIDEYELASTLALCETIPETAMCGKIDGQPVKCKQKCTTCIPQMTTAELSVLNQLQTIEENQLTIPQRSRLETLQQKSKGLSSTHIWTGLGCFPTDITGLISTVFTVLIGILGGFILLCIIVEGMRIMTSAGNPEAMKKAQEGITSCIIGFIVVFFSVLILRIIGVDILDLPWFEK